MNNASVYAGAARRTFGIWALIGIVSLGAFLYLIQAAGMRDWSGPLWFLKQRWYFLVPLVLGFGYQMGLYGLIRKIHAEGRGVLAASGGVSGGAMAACCAHNVVAFIPVLGFFGLAGTLTRYQTEIFLFSIASVLVGAILMTRTYRRLRKPAHPPDVSNAPLPPCCANHHAPAATDSSP